MDDDNPLSFKRALDSLYSKDHQAKTKDDIEKASLRRKLTIHDMQEYLNRTGISLPRTVDIIHITGTKGKGSTASICESLLRNRDNLNTGLFTSPHLVDIRERIRIGGRPVSKDTFAQAYWHVRQKLEENDQGYKLPTLPGYFRMLTLLALHIFSTYEPPIDVIILEVGMGGRYDATNIFDLDCRNVVCGVTLIDFDHTRVLGTTLEQIAWEKGGIFQVHKGSQYITPTPLATDKKKSQHPSNISSNLFSEDVFFTISTNKESVLSVLKKCAALEGEGRNLCVVETDSILSEVNLGLQGSHQRINASLALALCNSIIKVKRMQKSPDIEYEKKTLYALEHVSWPGRCQVIQDFNSTMSLWLDGAHTLESMKACLDWFKLRRNVTPQTKSILIFNCSHERNPVPLLQLLHKCHIFKSVYFCTAGFERPSKEEKLPAEILLKNEGYEVDGIKEVKCNSIITWQETLAEIWSFLEQENKANNCDLYFNLNVLDAINDISMIKHENESTRIDILVVGSLYLVGSALQVINWKEEDAEGYLKM